MERRLLPAAKFILGLLVSLGSVDGVRADRFSWETEISTGAYDSPNSWHGPNYPEHTRFPGAADDVSISGGPTVIISGAQASREVVMGHPTLELVGSYTVESLFTQGAPVIFQGQGQLNGGLWQLGARNILSGVKATVTTLQPFDGEVLLRDGALLTSEALDTSRGGLKVTAQGQGSLWKHSSLLPFVQIVLRDGGRAELTETDGVNVDLEGGGSILRASGKFSGYGRVANGSRIESAEGRNSNQTTIDGGAWAVSGLFVNAGADMIVQNGGRLNAGKVSAGELSSETMIAGAGSRFDIAGSLSFLGILRAKDGGAVTANTATLSVGSVITETGGIFSVANEIFANSAVSALTGGQVSAGEIFLGDVAGRFGALTVRDSGSRAQIAGALSIGQVGEGLLSVRDKGLVISGVAGLGLLAGAKGEANLTGAGSEWRIIPAPGGGLVIGQAGSGSIAVANGAALNLTLPAEVRLASEASGKGELRLTGSGSQVRFRPATVVVGGKGQGTLQLDAGSSLEAGTVVVGRSGLDNRVTVNDESILEVLNEMVVGEGGRGTFSLQRGAQGVIRRLIIGRNSASENSAVLSGIETRFNGSDRIYVGELNGTGRLELIDGAQARPGQGLGLAVYDGAKGHLLIDRGAYLETASAVIIGGGQGSQATAAVQESGSIDCLNLLVLAQPAGMATLELSGESSVIEVRDQLDVGFSGRPAGPALFKVGANSFLSVVSNVFVNPRGRLEILGRAKIGAAVYPAAGTISIGPGGRLRGASRVVANIELAGGKLVPGSSPGTLTIEGNYTQKSGSLEIEIAGPQADSEYDVLNVTGVSTLGGILSISFMDGFAPRAGQRFAIVTSGGGTSGTFSTVEINGLAPGFRYAAAADASGTFILTAQNDGIPTSLPPLRVSLGVRSAVLSWPATGTWILESSASLAPANWQTVLGTPIMADDRLSLSVPVSSPQLFYRLRQ